VISQRERLRRASRRRREQEKQELRQAILAASAELILERGYDGFSLRQVAERIGYSATTIYLYFRDKDDLVGAVVAEGFARFLRRLEAVRTADPLARLGELGRAYVRFGLDNPVFYQLMFMQRADLLARARGPESPPEGASFRVLLDAVQAAIDAGVLRPGDARAYSGALWAMVHGIVALAIAMPSIGRAGAEQLTEVALGMASRGLAP
jgi:AcrR family transcriptional regulator